ncbi:hypothetical protein RRF57_011359 [Xylaria bambusicola]|uniref:NAD(P)-binding domain-containing protein n=1 Tax=Xylaria bambusicola TaxID=326684 RepID=A0AAN7ZA13_9PEZI
MTSVHRSKCTTNMKLIIAGSTGFLATELIRQALVHPGVTSVIALGRREASSYAKTLRIIPTTSNWKWQKPMLVSVSWEEVCKISRDYAVIAIETISQLRRDKPNSKFRFVYVSGHTATRDPSKKPLILPDYSVMRGEAETLILKRAQESNGSIEACIAKPGLIDDPKDPRFWTRAAKNFGRMLFGIPKVEVREIAATLIDQVVNGIEKDTLENKDLVRIGTKVLAAQTSSP